MTVTMAKEPDKKSRTPGKKGKGKTTRENQAGFRAFDPALIEALDAYAASLEDRSRNWVMNRLLEEALRDLGFWPWPREAQDTTE